MHMSSVSPNPVTIREYMKFQAPEGYRDELIYGRIIVSPEPKPLHFQIAENVCDHLRRAVQKRWKVAQRINLRFSDAQSMPSPDVFVVDSPEWLSALENNRYSAGSKVVLAVEVVSPGNRKKAIQQKVDLYGSHGIVTWVIHPKNKTVQVFEGDRRREFMYPDKLPLPASLGTKSLPLEIIFNISQSGTCAAVAARHRSH
jgi:Uma2 family endonuclease